LRAASDRRHARGAERVALHCRERLRVEAAAEMLSAGLDGSADRCTWRIAGLLDVMNAVLVMNLREIEGRDASSSAGVIDR